MSAATIKRLLHVEDDPMQQRVLAHHLKAISESSFEIVAVESEESGMQAFQTAAFDIVVVDYQLREGDGLHLLRRLRQLDPLIPIIAISGVATSEVAAELVQAGADDYFVKRDLTSAALAKSIRAALLRADTVRKRTPVKPHLSAKIDQQFLELCQYFVAKVGTGLGTKLDALEHEVRQAKLQPGDLEVLFKSICSRIEIKGSDGQASPRLLLRPVMLELFVRVAGDLTTSANGSAST